MDEEELQERTWIVIAERDSQEGPPTVNCSHIASKVSQCMEPKHIEEQVKNPYVPPLPSISSHE